VHFKARLILVPEDHVLSDTFVQEQNVEERVTAI